MKRNDIIRKMLFIPLALLMLSLGGCYNNFDNPDVNKVYTDADFAGSTIIPIKQLKQIFYDKYGTGSNSVGKSVEVADNYVIKGKVISNDAFGNIYKSIYIQDESGAIEIKIGVTTLYNEYKIGQTVYVKAQGLVIGSYRYMLSLGIASPTSDYANAYMEVWPLINTHVFCGEQGKLTASDTTVINSPSELNDDYLGMLLRINGLTSFYGTWDSDVYPSFLEQIDDVYNNYSFIAVIDEWKAYEKALAEYEKNPVGIAPVAPKSPRPATLDYPTYAYNYDNNRYYGTALFKFGGVSGTTATQNLLVRSSGYSRFALDALPDNGEVVNITAIYTKYSAKSGSYIKYQLLLNNVTDVVKVN